MVATVHNFKTTCKMKFVDISSGFLLITKRVFGNQKNDPTAIRKKPCHYLPIVVCFQIFIFFAHLHVSFSLFSFSII